MSQFRHDVMPEEDVAHVIDHTVHLHLKDSRRTALGWEYPAIGDVDVTTRLTAPFGTGGR